MAFFNQFITRYGTGSLEIRTRMIEIEYLGNCQAVYHSRTEQLKTPWGYLSSFGLLEEGGYFPDSINPSAIVFNVDFDSGGSFYLLGSGEFVGSEEVLIFRSAIPKTKNDGNWPPKKK